MNANRQAILTEMGFKLWQLREQEPQLPEATLPVAEASLVQVASPIADIVPVAPPIPGASAVEQMGWDELSSAVHACRACELCKHRHQAVLGVGDRQADWLFVGEGPGAEEDVQGEPFVGQAGKLLDAMLAAIGLRREEGVYIANAVKCRPEGNRTPHAAEMAACRPFLMRQIELLKPKLIVLLGKVAVHSVLGEDKSLASMRQKPFKLGNIPVLVTYHPAYLLRNLPEKAKAWEDLCLARRQMHRAKE